MIKIHTSGGLEMRLGVVLGTLIWAVIIIGYSACANADEYTGEAVFGVYTDHVQPGKFNENNEFVAFRYKNAVCGTLKNSYNRRTQFCGGMWEWGGDGIVWGASAGVMYGYCAELLDPGKPMMPDCESVPLPYVSPYIGFNADRVTVRAHSFSTAVIVTVGFGL